MPIGYTSNWYSGINLCDVRGDKRKNYSKKKKCIILDYYHCSIPRSCQEELYKISRSAVLVE